MRLRDFIPDDGSASLDDPHEGVEGVRQDTRNEGHDGRQDALNADMARPSHTSGVRRVGEGGETTSQVRSAMRRSSQAAKSYATRTFPAVAVTPDERASASRPGSPFDEMETHETLETLAGMADPATTMSAPRPAPRRRRASGGEAATDPTLPASSAPAPRARRSRAKASSTEAGDAPNSSGALDVAPGALRRRTARSKTDVGEAATLAGPDAQDAPDTSLGRRRKSARPASAREQALVERTTQFLDATEVLNRLDAGVADAGPAAGPDHPMSSGPRYQTRAPVSNPFAGGGFANGSTLDDADALDDTLATRQLAMIMTKTAVIGTSGVHWGDAEASDETERLPATFIPGAMTPATRMSEVSSGKLPVPAPVASLASSLATTISTATTLPPRAPRHRRWGVDALMTVVVTAILLSLLGATSPLWRTPLQQAQQRFAPQGAVASIGQINQPPTGPWSSSVSIASNLEIGGGAGPGVKAPGSAGLPGNNNGGNGNNNTGGNGSGAISSPPFYPWPPSWAFTPPPGYYSWAVAEPSPDNYWWAFGQCTWWAQHMRGDEYLKHMGNAQYWASSAAARGYSVGSTPVAGATVVFQPGVQGAGGAGHVAHVEKVYPDGWFLISEMNFYWNGGGWGRVDYRYAHSGWGVQFIY